MSKKIILLFAGLVFFYSYNLAHADVVINEFVSHPNTGENEWVELLNTSTNPQDLTGWKLTELTTPSTTPVEVTWITLSGAISANGVLVFENSGSKFNDGGDSIGLYDTSNNPVSRVTYGTNLTVQNYSINLAAPTTGKSGALISGIWQTNQDPTKGSQNPNASVAPAGGSGLVTSGDSDSEASSSTTTTTQNKTAPKDTPIETKIIASGTAFAGIPLVFQGSAFGHQAEPLNYGKYFWNFGDGDSKEVQLTDMNNNQKITHTYFYPGEYNVSLEYSLNYYAEAPDATDKMTIKVVPADISISSVGDDKDFFIELSNNTDYDADISNWILESNAKSFTIPRNTVIGSKNKIMISGKITNFSITDKDTLKLITSEGETAFDYAASTASVVAISPKPPSSPLSGGSTSAPAKGRIEEGSSPDISFASDTENLSAISAAEPASAVSSGAIQNNDTNSSQEKIIFIVSILFIGASAGIVYFVRRKRLIPGAGNDFEILDE